MKEKYWMWGLVGIGVAALFYFLTKQDIQQKSQTVPYLVQQPLQSSNSSSPQASTSLSTQPNIIGTSPASTVPNYTMPNLLVSSPQHPSTNTQSGMFSTPATQQFQVQGTPNTQPVTS